MKKHGIMIRSAIVLLAALVLATPAKAQQINNGLSLGFQLNQYQNDFGAGLTLTTPYFADNKLAVRLKGNLMFRQHEQDNETTWTPYGNLTLGLAGVSGMVGEAVRLYGEGGFVGLFPSSDFSSESFVFGGYGLFGFEFFMNEKANYFIELGGIGTGAKADKVENSPVYSNGFLASVGFRIGL